MSMDLFRGLITSLLIITAVNVFANNNETNTRCKQYAATLEAAEGVVELLIPGQTQWLQVTPGSSFCYGDRLRVTEFRASVRLSNDTLMRLKEDSSVHFIPPDKSFWVEILEGAAHFISRTPKEFKVKAPYVNAVVDGTEFFINIRQSATELFVVEGHVLTKNSLGEARIGSGQSVVTKIDSPPVHQLNINADDTVNWTLYFPPIANVILAPDVEINQRLLQGDAKAFLSYLDSSNAEYLHPQLNILKAAVLLSIGQLEEANRIIQAYDTSTDKRDYILSESLSIMIDLARGNTEESLINLKKLKSQGADDPFFNLVSSYVYQSNLMLNQAFSEAQKAANTYQSSAYLWTRLAEISLVIERPKIAKSALSEAKRLGGDNSYWQAMKSVYLLQENNFSEAYTLLSDSIKNSDSLPMNYLLYGLVSIRLGHLSKGRKNIELAVLTDPNNSLLRSYMGKTYSIEKRYGAASDQFILANLFDPHDPTPYFYRAIQYQSMGHYTKALKQMDRANMLNTNRAVYRSRTQLDRDSAARGASLADIYLNLELADKANRLAADSKRLNYDEYAPFKILADVQSRDPRSDLASSSEYLQAQLRQPLTAVPLRPSLTEKALLVMPGAGPSSVGLHEYNALLNRNRNHIMVSTAQGTDNTESYSLAATGLYNIHSYGLEAYKNQSRGFENNGLLSYEIKTLTYHIEPSKNLDFILEYKDRTDERQNAVILLANDNNSEVFDELREKTGKLGMSYSPNSNVSIYSSLIKLSSDYIRNSNSVIETPTSTISSIADSSEDTNFESGELAVNLDTSFGTFYTGIQKASSEKFSKYNVDIFFNSFLARNESNDTPSDSSYEKSYIYLHTPSFSGFELAIGATYVNFDAIDYIDFDTNAVNYKAAIHWSPSKFLNFDIGYFENIAGLIENKQTLELTNLFGLTQFTDDKLGAESETVAARFDGEIEQFHYALLGYERDVYIPQIGGYRADERGSSIDFSFIFDGLILGINGDVSSVDIDLIADSIPNQLDTQEYSIDVIYNYNSGLLFKASISKVFQRRDFYGATNEWETNDKKENFSVFNWSLSKSINNVYGESLLLALEVRNMFGSNFKYQTEDFLDNSPSVPDYSEKQAILGRLTWLF